MSDYQPAGVPYDENEEDEGVTSSRPVSRSAPVSVPIETSQGGDDGCARWGAALIVMVVLGVLAGLSYQMRGVYFPGLASTPSSSASHVISNATNIPKISTPGQSGYVIPELSIRCQRSQGTCHFAVETPVLVSAPIEIGQAAECILTTAGSTPDQQVVVLPCQIDLGGAHSYNFVGALVPCEGGDGDNCAGLVVAQT